MKNIITSIFCAFICLTTMTAQTEKTDLFDLLNLSNPGLSQVKELYDKGDTQGAKAALLTYDRSKTASHPDIDFNNITLSSQEKKWADEALEHKFFVHSAYQPSYFYGEDINWEYWPIKDNELRWQLHRTKWWIPMGKSYALTNDEKYAQEWVHQYLDWIKKNPLNLDKYHNDDPSGDVELMDNVLFAWRPMEVSHRLQDQTILFQLFLNSPNFTPDFLEQYLINFDKHAEHLYNNYSEKGNHLLFEAQRLLFAGASFPEFKEAEKWRKSGVDVLLNEINEQVFEDGVQYELDPSYHLASINIFVKAARMAQVKGFAQEFPARYYDTIEKMVDVVMDTTFPNYTYPLFSDSRLANKRVMLKNFEEFANLFPENKAIQYFASDRKEGEKPNYLSKAYQKGGFFIFRNGWDTTSTQMILKAGPEAFWHNQPDNGTFELWQNGRNFFIDSGSFVYGGDAEVLKQRAWFKQTRVHNTLTLDNKNLEETNSKCLLWETSPELDVLVTENQSYSKLKHRRSVFFVDQKYFVILDEAIGADLGEIGIHYHFSPGEVDVNTKRLEVNTTYPDNNNIKLQVFGTKNIEMIEQEGWTSPAIRQKTKRPSFTFEQTKSNDNPIRFITIISPSSNEIKVKPTKAKISKITHDNTEIQLNVTIDGKKYKLGYKL